MAEVLFMFVILLLAGCLQGVSGFGFGLLSVGLLGLVWPDPKTATVLPILPNIAICSYAWYRHRQYLPWQRIWPFIAATLVGIPLGVWMLRSIDMTAARLGIGLLLIFGAIYGWLPLLSRHHWHRLYIGLPLGLASGFLSGAFNTGGPPAIAYMSNQQLTRFAIVSGLQAVFLIAAGFRLICLIGAGLMPPRIAELSALGVLTAVAGVALGTMLLHRINDKLMQHGLRLAQLILGSVYLIQIKWH